jgi:catechol 2,3-dioxygenase-like lactoylglutathione lyase family enzyme
MKPRITAVTLGADDLKKSLAFYRDDLGLSTQGRRAVPVRTLMQSWG